MDAVAHRLFVRYVEIVIMHFGDLDGGLDCDAMFRARLKGKNESDDSKQEAGRGALCALPSASCGHNPCAIYLDRDASLQQIDGQNENAFLQSVLHEEALDALQRSTRDADALSFPQVRMRRDVKSGLEHLL